MVENYYWICEKCTKPKVSKKIENAPLTGQVKKANKKKDKKVKKS